MGRNIVVTGCAGFIGFHLSKRLLELGDTVVGIDNMNDYYDVTLKERRLALLEEEENFTFCRLSLEDKPAVDSLFAEHKFDRVVNLAAQAGVRYSLQNPQAYVSSNLVGFVNILEACRHAKVPELVYASSSSVYGSNVKYPFAEKDSVDHPVSLYAASKKSNELLAHSYSSLFGLPTVGLRFFTVYGPWGRPDMALFLFTKAILEGKPIEVFNNGDMQRDFTYIDDIIEGVVNVLKTPPKPDPDWDRLNPSPETSYAPYRLYNIGNDHCEQLMDMIGIIEKCLGKEAEKIMMPMQKGDVQKTSADIDLLRNEFGFSPTTTIETGIPKFIEWYRDFYNV